MKYIYKRFLLLSLPFITHTALAQHTISGRVRNEKGQPVRGANVYLDNTIDGGTADSAGMFSFTTTETGNQTVVATALNHSTAGQPIVINGDVKNVQIVLQSNTPKDLDVVVITAGSMDAGNDKSKTVLKPLDIVTTAGSGADVVKAMQMLPGTQQTGPDNGLFVRGGDANEAAVIVDEMIVQNAFFSGAPGVATRSRFGAFQYQGVAFSSGGYSARYGQALSGVLELNTTDLPDKSTINLGANMGGVYVSGVKKWKHSALDGGGGYTNLAPFYKVVKSNFDFYKVPEGGNGNVRYMWKPNKDGILKVTLTTQHNATGVRIPNPFSFSPDPNNPQKPDTTNFLTRDQNYYSNVSYRQMFKHKWMLYAAASVSHNDTRTETNSFNSDNVEYRRQARVEGKRYFNSRLNLMLGADVQNFGQERSLQFDTVMRQKYNEVLTGAYAEMEWTPVNRFAIRPGVRYEHSTLMNVDKVAPRLSMALKTGSYSQASVAGGVFYQQAPAFYLLQDWLPGYNTMDMQMATHYIANWQWSRDNRTLRLEGYYKDYQQLILETAPAGTPFNPNLYRFTATGITNNGNGYAQGIDLFWRDKKTFKNTDYWVSYSYIDTRRKYMNYPELATPTFIANHNLNVVGKYWIDKIKTSVNATYSYASGRPYYNPGTTGEPAPAFLSQRTPDYHSLSLTAAYLHSFGKWFTVFYISVDNVTRRENIFGYRYAPDGKGSFTMAGPIVPALYRTVFFGVNMSLSEFSKDEL